MVNSKLKNDNKEFSIDEQKIRGSSEGGERITEAFQNMKTSYGESVETFDIAFDEGTNNIHTGKSTIRNEYATEWEDLGKVSTVDELKDAIQQHEKLDIETISNHDNVNIMLNSNGDGTVSVSTAIVSNEREVVNEFSSISGGDIYNPRRNKQLKRPSERDSVVDTNEQLKKLKQKQTVVSDGDTTIVTKDMPEDRKIERGVIKVNDGTYLKYRNGKQWEASKAPRVMIKNDDLVDEMDADSVDEALDELERMSDKEVDDLENAFYHHRDREQFEVDESDWKQYARIMRKRDRLDDEDREVNPDKLPEKLNPKDDGWNTPFTESIYLSEITDGESIGEMDISKSDVIKYRFGTGSIEGVVSDDEAEELVERFEDGYRSVDDIADVIGDELPKRADKEEVARGIRPYLVTVEKRWANEEDDKLHFEDDISQIPILGTNGSITPIKEQNCGKGCEGCPHGTYAHIKFRDSSGKSTSRYAGKTRSYGHHQNFNSI